MTARPPLKRDPLEVTVTPADGAPLTEDDWTADQEREAVGALVLLLRVLESECPPSHRAPVHPLMPTGDERAA